MDPKPPILFLPTQMKRPRHEGKRPRLNGPASPPHPSRDHPSRDHPSRDHPSRDRSPIKPSRDRSPIKPSVKGQVTYQAVNDHPSRDIHQGTGHLSSHQGTGHLSSRFIPGCRDPDQLCLNDRRGRSLRAVRLFHRYPRHEASIDGGPNVTGWKCFSMRQPSGRRGAPVPYHP